MKRNYCGQRICNVKTTDFIRYLEVSRDSIHFFDNNDLLDLSDPPMVSGMLIELKTDLEKPYPIIILIMTTGFTVTQKRLLPISVLKLNS
jgi:hypothetical protein